jgi:cysteine desulfurase / selenocysteine lyase
MSGLADDQDFELGDAIWLNCAHQGPLPRVAVEAAERTAHQKAAPWRIDDDDFITVPNRLRKALASLMDASPDDVVLGNSASYGLDLLARGLDWKQDDEILYVKGEFPASVFPWQVAQSRGARMRSFAAAQGNIPDPDELAAAISPQTRVFVCSWVNSFTGHTLDVAQAARICREADILFVLNASQAAGAQHLSLRHLPLDAVTCCGYKWLLGPYATGFCWISPPLRDRLSSTPVYWLPNVWGSDSGLQSYSPRTSMGARGLDVFGTANFLSFIPWTTALEYVVDTGVAKIEVHNAGLVGTLIARLDHDRLEVVSPRTGPRQSAIVVLRPRRHTRSAEQLAAALSEQRIYAATRNGALRISPNFYNSRQQMEQAASILNRLSA